MSIVLGCAGCGNTGSVAQEETGLSGTTITVPGIRCLCTDFLKATATATLADGILTLPPYSVVVLTDEN